MQEIGATAPADLPKGRPREPAGEPLKVAFIVTEYPKTTETFIMRDVMDLHRMGCEIRIFHLTHFNSQDTIHDFARPTLAWATDYAYLASPDVIGATLGTLVRQPSRVLGILRDIVKGCLRDPVMMLKSLFILPKSMRIAAELKAWKADHVHAAYAGHPCTTAWIVRRITGIPFSCSSHAHDLFETQALLAEKLPEAAFVRTISEYNKAFILWHVPALKDHPPVVIHVGNYLSDPRPARPPQTGGLRLLYVGSLEYRKGVDLLLLAVHRLTAPGWRLDILGDGPERAKLEELAANLGLNDRVTFHGRQRNEAVQQAMQQASLLVVPSRIGPRNQTEGLPTVIVEAFSSELPVIATRLTGIPEIIRPGETGLLFEMEDVAGITSAIETVVADPDTAAAWARNGRRLVEQEFDQRINAARLLDLIRAATGRPHGRRDGMMGADSGAPKRILLLFTRDPRGRMSGRKMVLTTIVQSLLGLGHEVTVAHFGAACVAPSPADPVRYIALTGPSAPERLLNLSLAFLVGHRSLNEALYDNSRARREIDGILAGESFDLVVTDMIRTAPYGARTGLPWIADLDDLLSSRYTYLAAHAERTDNLIGYHDAPLLRRLPLAKVLPLILRREARILARREDWVVAKADFVTLVSEAEAAELSARASWPVGATPMAVAGPDSPPGTGNRPREMVFVGGLDYGPNYTSLRDFGHRVIPVLQAQGIHDFRLDVIGLAETKHRQGLPPDIVLRGYIDDLNLELQSYRAMLVPEVPPGGVKTKIIVAALNGTVVLAHVTALEGMGLESGRSVLAWSTPEELAGLIARLRGGEIDIAALSETARAWAQRRYGPILLRETWGQNISICLAAASRRSGGAPNPLYPKPSDLKPC
jgi:glycosyltransferase involved in cell wall biosynthesis